MNIPELAESDQLCNKEIIHRAYIIYVTYNKTAGLNEVLITYFYSISKMPAYQIFLKDMSKVLFALMRQHIDPDSDTPHTTSRQNLFSIFHNLTESEEIC